MSSSPTLDGSDHPAHSSGQSPEAGNPASLARSVPASVCPAKPDNPESTEPEAATALKASDGFQINSEKKDHLSLQGHSPCASAAAQSPAMPLQRSSEEAGVADSLEVAAERSTQSLRFHLHTRQEVNLSITTTRMHEPQMFVGEEGWHPENQNPSQVNDLQQHQEPENEQHEAVPRDAPCDTGDLELPGERQQKQEVADWEATMRGGHLQQNAGLPDPGEGALPSGRCGCSNSETLMEVGAAEQSLVAALSSAGRQNASVGNGSASDLTLGNPSMEVELSPCSPSSEILNGSIPIQDLQPPEGSVEMPGTDSEYGGRASSSSVCGSSQPPAESAEESCSSITTALKELHELLVISSKPASEAACEEVMCQSEGTAEGQPCNNLSARWTENERRTQDEARPQVSREAIPVSVKTEKLTDTSPDTGIEDGENTTFQGPGGGLSTHNGAPRSGGSVHESRSVTVTASETSSQSHCTLGVGISPGPLPGEGDALSQTSEQTKSLLVKDLGQGTQNPAPDRPETREDVCRDAARPSLEVEPPTSHSSSRPCILPPLGFPAADVDRILRAGFTLQEALGALHRVGGNADLALLVLLAKNIVVPT